MQIPPTVPAKSVPAEQQLTPDEAKVIYPEAFKRPVKEYTYRKAAYYVTDSGILCRFMKLKGEFDAVSVEVEFSWWNEDRQRWVEMLEPAWDVVQKLKAKYQGNALETVSQDSVQQQIMAHNWTEDQVEQAFKWAYSCSSEDQFQLQRATGDPLNITGHVAAIINHWRYQI